MRTTLMLLCGLLFLASCGTPARRERWKISPADAAVSASDGEGTYVYGSESPGTDAGTAAAANSAASNAPKMVPAGTIGKGTAGAETTAPGSSGADMNVASSKPGASGSKGAKITSQILTTKSQPPQYTVAVFADVPDAGYDFGIDHSRFDGDVLTLYLDLKEPPRSSVKKKTAPVLERLTARYVSGRRPVSAVRVYVNVVHSNGKHSGFKLIQ